MNKRCTVSDGKLMLHLEEAVEGGYIVTSPLDPELITQAETIGEAFANARDATKALKQSRAKLLRRLASIIHCAACFETHGWHRLPAGDS